VRKNTSEALEGCFGSPEPVQRRSGERPMSFGGSGLTLTRIPPTLLFPEQNSAAEWTASSRPANPNTPIHLLT
jgi:hypothetical protein